MYASTPHTRPRRRWVQRSWRAPPCSISQDALDFKYVHNGLFHDGLCGSFPSGLRAGMHGGPIRALKVRQIVCPKRDVGNLAGRHLDPAISARSQASAQTMRITRKTPYVKKRGSSGGITCISFRVVTHQRIYPWAGYTRFLECLRERKAPRL